MARLGWPFLVGPWSCYLARQPSLHWPLHQNAVAPLPSFSCSLPTPVPPPQWTVVPPSSPSSLAHLPTLDNFLRSCWEGSGSHLAVLGSTREALCQTHHKKAPPVSPGLSISDTSSLSLLFTFPLQAFISPIAILLSLPKKTPVLLPKLRHPHTRGLGQDSSCHSRFLRLDSAYSVSGPAITTLRAAGGRVCCRQRERAHNS